MHQFCYQQSPTNTSTINMKFLVFAALIAVAAATTYSAATYEKKYEEVTYAPQPYSFSYGVKDDESYTDFVHSEKADGYATSGSYRVALPDGRIQIVTYRADANGNVADVKYEGEAKYPEYKEVEYKAYPAPAYQAYPTYKAPAYPKY